MSPMLICRCANTRCELPFRTNRFSTKVFEEMEYGNIICPHCGNSEPADHAAYYLSNPLTQAERVQFEINFPPEPVKFSLDATSGHQ